jgi:DNA invertase Pin-like site-specific DNA recombinase
MPTYAYTRASTLKQDQSPIVQADIMRRYCENNKLGEPKILDEPLGTSGVITRFRDRPQGRWLLLNAQRGDILVVTKLDRLGRKTSELPFTG